jgi:diadenosine tetraphosphate (Ap4A) HIT family hydrolase
MEFQLHPRLAQDCLIIGRLPLSLLLLMNDKQYPWLILVPRLSNLREIHHLSRDNRIQLMDESCLLAETMIQLFEPEKLNIAAIGNLVPQLHVHHVARYSHDPAWPAPVWGHSAPQPYEPQAMQETLLRIRNHLGRLIHS